jgi:prepilin-type N-terminal cleavage/methylation domain-containing protein
MPGGKNIQFRKKSQGYTIVEVMIVLAISGMMFVIAANFINGKQARTAFTQGVSELTSQIQGAIADVSDGKYSDIALNCTEVDGQAVVTSDNDDSMENQGTHDDCVFRGKLVSFYADGTDKPEKYEVVPLVDLRSADDAVDTPTNLDTINSNSILVQKKIVPQNLTIENTVTTNTTTNPIANKFNIGFVQSLGVTDADGIKQGSQSINLIYLDGHNGEDAVTPDALGTILPAKSFKLCITDGTRYAIIDVGSDDSNKLTVTSHILGVSTTC